MKLSHVTVTINRVEKEAVAHGMVTGTATFTLTNRDYICYTQLMLKEVENFHAIFHLILRPNNGGSIKSKKTNDLC